MRSQVKKLMAKGIVLVSVTAIYFIVDARYSPVFPKCPFYILTNFFCPGCGSQRALSAMLHGQFIEAFTYNALLMLSLPFLFYSAGVSCINAFRQKQVIQHIFYSGFFVRLLLIAVVSFWILRNIPIHPFNALAPEHI